MIGEILIGERSAVRLDDNGYWEAVEPEFQFLAEFLDMTHSPLGDHLPGDSASPFGVRMLYRAAERVKNGSVVLAQAVPPVIEGATN